MKSIAVFDFDGTLYRKDSLLEFCKFIYLKRPYRILFFPIQLFGFLFFKLKIISAKQFKQLFCVYLVGIVPVKLNKLLSEFWDTEFPDSFNAELLERAVAFSASSFECVCVSASPEIFLKPVTYRLGFKLIGTRLEYKKGFYVIHGNNCRGKEKIERISSLYHKQKISIEFAASDNIDDKELLNMAKEALFIRKE